MAVISPLLAPRLDLAEDVPVAHTGVNPFGINTFFDQEPDAARLEASMRLLADAGFGWIRQQFPWADIEQPAKGQYWDTRWSTSSWAKYDRIVALARRYGLQVIARLDSPPAWARRDQRWPYGPPDRYEDFGDFVATVVARYRGQVRYFQIWNEPNLTIEWGMQPPSVADYVRLLRIAYERAKAANPEAVILAAALAPTIEEGPDNISDLTFLRQMYALGARPYFDIASFNPYGLRSGPHDRRARTGDTNVSRVLLARAIMVAHGDAAKPIWAGELGWNALPLDFPDAPTHGRVTREQQARYTVDLYVRALNEWPWMGVLNLWHFWKPGGDPRRQQDVYFGVVDDSLRPYTIFGAMRALARSQPWLGQGYHQESHWALRYSGGWKETEAPQASLGRFARGRAGDRVAFAFAGTALDLVLRRGPGAARLAVVIDGAPTRATELPVAADAAVIDVAAPAESWQVRVPIARHLPPGRHDVRLEVRGPGTLDLDAVVVSGPPNAASGAHAWLLGSAFALAAIAGTWLSRPA